MLICQALIWPNELSTVLSETNSETCTYMAIDTQRYVCNFVKAVSLYSHCSMGLDKQIWWDIYVESSRAWKTC